VSAPRSLSIGTEVSVATVAFCAGLVEADILTTGHAPLVASVGTEFVVAELTDLAALARATPDIGAFRRAVAAHPELAGRLGLLLYVRLDGDATRLQTRMFAPLLGVMEDPATGSANAALAALLTSMAPGDNVELAFDIAQGIEMGRPSRLFATSNKTAEGPVTATIAGNCVPATRGVYDAA
jgi:trans-2,3-dihydro-3-hydroxyanthranilate isomerase